MGLWDNSFGLPSSSGPDTGAGSSIIVSYICISEHFLYNTPPTLGKVTGTSYQDTDGDLALLAQTVLHWVAMTDGDNFWWSLST